MKQDLVIKALHKLKFTPEDVEKLSFFCDYLLNFNQKYNLIAKSTEYEIWTRHILDSAQIVKFINFKSGSSLSDLGSGGGFPGIIISIFNKNPAFHVKLHEKSPVKCDFLNKISEKIDLNCEVITGDLNAQIIDSQYIVCRAFKKMPEIMRISREIANKPHKIIILKGKSAQEEINKALKLFTFEYKLESSITNEQSKIFIANIL